MLEPHDVADAFAVALCHYYSLPRVDVGGASAARSGAAG
jgi:Holliday junction resolvasome RuvABC endonuclease subunit